MIKLGRIYDNSTLDPKQINRIIANGLCEITQLARDVLYDKKVKERQVQKITEIVISTLLPVLKTKELLISEYKNTIETIKTAFKEVDNIAYNLAAIIGTQSETNSWYTLFTMNCMVLIIAEFSGIKIDFQ